jgi:hypothetical protein
MEDDSLRKGAQLADLILSARSTVIGDIDRFERRSSVWPRRADLVAAREPRL